MTVEEAEDLKKLRQLNELLREMELVRTSRDGYIKLVRGGRRRNEAWSARSNSKDNKEGE